MSINGSRNLINPKSIKSLIIPHLPKNFHESLFFSEIQYQQNPTKKLRSYLINLYIQGIDYYNSQNKKDLSLYFQTKLLNIMKGIDYFENTITKKSGEREIEIDSNIDEEKQKILEKEKNISDKFDKVINEELRGQQNQFLVNLNMKKNLTRLKRISSATTERKSISNSLGTHNKKYNNLTLSKKVSVDLSSSLFHKEKDNKNNNNKNTNTVFSKIENALNGLDRINTLLIIEYTKKLRQYMKNELQKIEERLNKYNEYNKNKNELNLIYEEIEDKNGEEAKGIKEQIDLIEKEWKENNKKNEDDNKFNDKVIFDEKNLDNFIDNLYKKIEEIDLNNKY